MASYPPGGDYDERLLDNAPKATKAELQEGYNVNLLASDTSETPINQRTQATVDDHHSLEAGTPPSKEGYTSYAVPWYRQGKWRAIMLVGGIIIVGAIIGGVVGGVLSSKHKNPSAVNSGNNPLSSTSQTGAGAQGPAQTMSSSSVSSLQATQGNGGPVLTTVPVSTSTPGAVPSPLATSHEAPNVAVNMGSIPSNPAALIG